MYIIRISGTICLKLQNNNNNGRRRRAGIWISNLRIIIASPPLDMQGLLTKRRWICQFDWYCFLFKVMHMVKRTSFGARYTLITISCWFCNNVTWIQFFKLRLSCACVVFTWTVTRDIICYRNSWSRATSQQGKTLLLYSLRVPHTVCLRSAVVTSQWRIWQLVWSVLNTPKRTNQLSADTDFTDEFKLRLRLRLQNYQIVIFFLFTFDLLEHLT